MIKPSNISCLFNPTVSGYAPKPVDIGMYVITNRNYDPMIETIPNVNSI